MTVQTKKVLKSALSLSAIERVNLIDMLLRSIDQPDESIDDIWREEVEARIDAYKNGKIKSVSLEQVLAKYQK